MSFLTAAFFIFCVLKLAYSLQLTAQTQIPRDQEVVFLNGTSSNIVVAPTNFQHHIGIGGLTFRTCNGAPLFYQSSDTSEVLLELFPDGVVFYLKTPNNKEYETKLKGQFLDNSWHNVNIISIPGKNVTLSVDDRLEVSNPLLIYSL